MATFTVGYFVGSLSKASINRKLANALVRLAPAELVLTEIPFRDLPLYCYDSDADFPPAARALKEAIAGVDAILSREDRNGDRSGTSAQHHGLLQFPAHEFH